MSAIIIPSIEFREVSIQDVVRFLQDASVEGDPEGVGVSFVLNLADVGPGEPDPFEPANGDSPFDFGNDCCTCGRSDDVQPSV